MAKIKGPPPSFWRKALDDVRKRIPHYVELAIKAANEPPGMTVMVYPSGCYLLVDKILSEADRRALCRAWPLYLAEHGPPPHMSRMRLAGPSELVLVEP